MAKGRPSATYADPYMDDAEGHPGTWRVHVIDQPDSERIVRKVRRLGFEAKKLDLSTHHSVLALRSNHALHHPHPDPQH